MEGKYNSYFIEISRSLTNADRQSTPPHPPTLSESTLDSAEKNAQSETQSPADINGEKESPVTPRPPARTRNKGTKVTALFSFMREEKGRVAY